MIEVTLTRATTMAPGSVIDVPAQLASTAAWPLTASQVLLIGMVQPAGATLGSTMTIASAAGGLVRYTWQPADTDTAGLFDAECQVLYSDGGIETFPEDGYISIDIKADLGP